MSSDAEKIDAGYQAISRLVDLTIKRIDSSMQSGDKDNYQKTEQEYIETLACISKTYIPVKANVLLSQDQEFIDLFGVESIGQTEELELLKDFLPKLSKLVAKLNIKFNEFKKYHGVE